MTFSLGKRLFAIPLETVSEIVAVTAIQPIPRCRKGLMGVMIHREGVLPIFSLPAVLGMEGVVPGSILLVIAAGGETFGLPVDRAGEIIPWPEELDAVGKDDSPAAGRFTHKGMRCFILRLERVFASLLSGTDPRPPRGVEEEVRTR